MANTPAESNKDAAKGGAPEVQSVTLRPKGSKKDEDNKQFSISHGNKLLGLRNSQWEVNDENWSHNGKELVKKDKK